MEEVSRSQTASADKDSANKEEQGRHAALERAHRIRELLAEHVSYRESCLNLVAAENVLSPDARALLSSELVHRYADYTGRDLRARRYLGTRFIVGLEEEVHALLRELFRVAYVEPRALSGHIAGAASVMAFTRPGDVVLELDSPSGGHRIAEKLNATHYAQLDVRPLPFDPVGYTVDPGRTIEIAHRVRPRVIILGSSLFLFPHPVAEIASGLADLQDTLLCYDASHVLGLIAGGQFQDPLSEGAALMWASTHKSFPGPPGGLVMTQREGLINSISEAIYPGLVTNHHPGRMPALGLAAAEMIVHGRAYAAAIVSRACGARCARCRGSTRLHAESHPRSRNWVVWLFGRTGRAFGGGGHDHDSGEGPARVRRRCHPPGPPGAHPQGSCGRRHAADRRVHR
jgi:glycine hydroxymethyltransferase